MSHEPPAGGDPQNPGAPPPHQQPPLAWGPQYGSPPPPNAYPPGPYGQYGAPVAAPTNGMAIASLVLGIVWIYWIGSILALVFGYVGKGQIERSGGLQQGRGLAIAGIVLGWIGVGLLALTLFVVLVLARV